MPRPSPALRASLALRALLRRVAALELLLAPRRAANFLAAAGPRRLLLAVARDDALATMKADVLRGLATPGHRSLPPTYFYDELGSAIYDEITRIPEYYPARSEAAILARIAPELAGLVHPAEVVELGSGTAVKTELLLAAWGAAARPLTYVPIDVCREVVAASADRLLGRFPALRVLGLAGRYPDGLAALPPTRDRMVLFLGGTLGNFDPEQQARFSAYLARYLEPGSHFLLGFDRCAHPRKPAEVIQLAYDDPAGVTARFNLNLLAHLGRELGADFALASWAHRAVYNATCHQIEMYLESLADQVVAVAGLGRSYRFARGERILTELSRKFNPDELARGFAADDLHEVARWSDERDYFGLMLFRRG